MPRSIVPTVIARQPWGVVIPLMLLVGFSALVLYSAAGGSLEPYAASQMIRFGLFLVLAFGIRFVPRRLVEWAAYPAYLGVLVLLMLVEALGAIGGGSQRWLALGPLVLQPSELMKPVIVLALSKFYSDLPASMMTGWQALVPAGGLIALPMGLVLLQPDLGTALAIGFGGVVIMFLAGIPLRWFGLGGLAAAILVPLAYTFGLKDYQKRRVTTFMDPESDPLGAGYHITQSKIAIGSGGLTGKGFGNGSQSHLNYLPEPHTDFVFATMAEEWGFLGGLFVLAIFAIVLRWGLKIARRSHDRFAQLLAAGMVATIFFYAAINLMMVMGLAPVVGIPLPWMSHGGSSMLTNMLCVGVLMMIDRWNQANPRRGLG